MKKLFVVLFLVVMLAIPTIASADGAIPVHVFNDLNRDGAYDLYNGAVEPNLASVRINLYTDNTPVGSYGPEDTFYDSGYSNSSGYVVFSVPTGDYVVVSLHPEVEWGYTWIQSTPSSQYVSVGQAGGAITVEVGWYQVSTGGKLWH